MKRRKALLAYVALCAVLAYNFAAIERQRADRKEVNFESRAQVTRILCSVSRQQGNGLSNLLDLTLANAIKQRGGKPLTADEKEYVASLRAQIVIPDCAALQRRVR